MSCVAYRNKRALQQKYSFKSYKLNEFVKRRKKQNGKIMMTKRSKEKIIAYNQESNRDDWSPSLSNSLCHKMGRKVN